MFHLFLTQSYHMASGVLKYGIWVIKATFIVLLHDLWILEVSDYARQLHNFSFEVPHEEKSRTDLELSGSNCKFE